MAVNPACAPRLAALLDHYYTTEQLNETAELFGVPLRFDEYENDTRLAMLRFTATLLKSLETNNHRAFLDTLLDQLELRNEDAIASTQWEARYHHESLRPVIGKLRQELEADGGVEIALPAATPFSAKSQVRDLLETATTKILVVDAYVGVATLDCFRSASQPIRLLTSTNPKAVEAGFDTALADFRKEGFAIEVRRGGDLHDRHLSFNGRCWLVGSSLKDAGKKPFHCIEIFDTTAMVIADLEARWSRAKPYP